MPDDKATFTIVEQKEVLIPNLTSKELVAVIPKHCFERSALKSTSFVLRDVLVMTVLYQISTFLTSLIKPRYVFLPHPVLYKIGRLLAWNVYWYFGGMQMGGLWVLGHECGHGAFSESRLFCDMMGWLIHSSLGIPYFSWKNGHALHHASSGHMDLDPVYVPSTRSSLGLPPLDPIQEDLDGSRVSNAVKGELMEAIGDSPVGTTAIFFVYVVLGLPIYVCEFFYAQLFFPWRKDYRKQNSPLLTIRQTKGIILSDIGVFFWVIAVTWWIRSRGLTDFACIYLIPYLWCNHWAILVTFLQHTDPLIPHYRTGEHTFVRGALATFDRRMLAEGGEVMAWIAAFCGHGIGETHVVHHLCSRIPHYNAWEAKEAVDKRLAQAGLNLQGAPGGWAEMWRVLRQCKFVEDTGSIVFYKNAQGLAAARPVFQPPSGDMAFSSDADTVSTSEEGQVNLKDTDTREGSSG